MTDVLIEYDPFRELCGIECIILSLFRDNLLALVSSWHYDKVLLCFCVIRKGLYDLQTLWSEMF